MALPALAIPIGMGVAAAGGAISRASAARQQAEAMMPDAYRRRLEELQARQRAGTLGLSEAQQGLIESEGAAARAAVAADARAQQLQRAQSQGAGFAGRDMFLADLASQQTQAQMMSQTAQQIDAANERARLEQEQQLLELQQREADAEAARRSIPRQLAADLFGVAASTAGQAFTSAQMAKQQEDLLAALARGDTAARDQAFYGQMATNMAGAFGGPGAVPPGTGTYSTEVPLLPAPPPQLATARAGSRLGPVLVRDAYGNLRPATPEELRLLTKSIPPVIPAPRGSGMPALERGAIPTRTGYAPVTGEPFISPSSSRR